MILRVSCWSILTVLNGPGAWVKMRSRNSPGNSHLAPASASYRAGTFGIFSEHAGRFSLPPPLMFTEAHSSTFCVRQHLCASILASGVLPSLPPPEFPPSPPSSPPAPPLRMPKVWAIFGNSSLSLFKSQQIPICCPHSIKLYPVQAHQLGVSAFFSLHAT